MKGKLSTFIKDKSKQMNLSQPELAQKAGVGLRFIREMGQGKTTLRMDKVNEVLKLFGYELGPVPMERKTNQ
jgi:y4mF family transcriptional regulator